MGKQVTLWVARGEAGIDLYASEPNQLTNGNFYGQYISRLPYASFPEVKEFEKREVALTLI